LLYPPFGSIVRIVVRSIDEQAAADWATHIADRLRKEAAALPQDDPAATRCRVLGPAPAPIARLRDRFRWHLQIHGTDDTMLRDVIRRATATLQTPDNVAWIVDVDPVEML